MLQQAVGEPAGRGAYIEAHLIGHAHAKLFERALELQPAAACVAKLAAGEFDAGVCCDQRTRLLEFLAVDAHLPGQDQPLRLLA